MSKSRVKRRALAHLTAKLRDCGFLLQQACCLPHRNPRRRVDQPVGFKADPKSSHRFGSWEGIHEAAAELRMAFGFGFANRLDHIGTILRGGNRDRPAREAQNYVEVALGLRIGRQRPATNGDWIVNRGGRIVNRSFQMPMADNGGVGFAGQLLFAPLLEGEG